MNAPFVLAAGGTGGHLFPAQALAGELMRRGRRVVVMTDGRGHNYGNAFPGAEIATVPAATFAGRSPFARVPALLHEQNAVLGRVNRLLAPRVAKIAASFPFARFAPKDSARVVFTGNPVRPEAAALQSLSYAPPAPDGPIRLLVFGGSQGARALSELVPAALALLPEGTRARLDITQQCRADDVAMVESAYRS